MSKPTEILISTDIESNGPIPNPFSMLSLGSAAFLPDGKLIDTFSANLDLLPNDPGGHPDTMKFWEDQPEAWKVCRENTRPPNIVMIEYVDWLKGLGNYTPTFLAYPLGFDFTFVYWYLMYFVGHSPFSFSGLCIKSYASAVLKKPFRQAIKRNFPKHWFKGAPRHDHTALNDAIGQGMIYFAAKKDNERGPILLAEKTIL